MANITISIGTILHELGHVLGYILSNSLQGAKLGEIRSVEIGNEKNCVTPKIGVYHFAIGEENKIIENTKNIPRTLAWFVEVLLGCTIHCVYENREINSCFAHGKNGNQDFINMAAIRALSSFTWKFDEIDTILYELNSIIQNRKVIEALMPIAKKIHQRLVASESGQLSYTGEELKELVFDVENSITTELKQDFQSLIKFWHLQYSIS